MSYMVVQAAAVAALLFFSSSVNGCTDILVTPSASEDGAAMIAYNADSPNLFGTVYHYPATNSSSSSAKTMRQIYDWDSGVYRGEIEEAPFTYNVVHNANEHGLVIGETTFGGVASLAWTQTDGIMDYGSLIYVTLQRAQTCREAIHIMANLMDQYGYPSGGESFSLADRAGQVWMMEVISRGPGRKGAVWVAQRIPDGHVAAHANQARITTFRRDDPANVLYASDVVAFAVAQGLYPATADPLEFSFSDVYCPLTFEGTRQGEARVWSIFSHIADNDQAFQQEYQEYARGVDRTKRMPLYIKPKKKLSLLEVTHLMASHYEGTVLDSSTDVGAGLFGSPNRPRPLSWEYNGTVYVNERNIAVPKTGWSFVAQVRPWMPDNMVALIWYAADDSSTAPRVPIYAASTEIAKPFAGKGAQDGVVTPLLDFDMDKAFWVQNMVSNFAYYRWKDVYPMLRAKIDEVLLDFIKQVAKTDQQALRLYHSSKNGADSARHHVTQFSVTSAQQLHDLWKQFYGELFVRFRDFYTIVPKADEPVCGCEAQEPGLSEAMKRRIVAETGDRYASTDDEDHPDVVFGEVDASRRAVQA